MLLTELFLKRKNVILRLFAFPVGFRFRVWGDEQDTCAVRRPGDIRNAGLVLEQTLGFAARIVNEVYLWLLVPVPL